MPEEIALVEATLRDEATVAPLQPADIRPVTGDPEDDVVRATARPGQAAYRVTGDRGLLDLGTYEGVRILSPRAFLAVLEGTATRSAATPIPPTVPAMRGPSAGGGR